MQDQDVIMTDRMKINKIKEMIKDRDSREIHAVYDNLVADELLIERIMQLLNHE